mmetsp:Transcript_52151/g.113558  ORF Transcript_52151/g.113558 Transcript_52151/m.113558 type:complete len:201 (-) Transcript_52151:229-831(-)
MVDGHLATPGWSSQDRGGRSQSDWRRRSRSRSPHNVTARGSSSPPATSVVNEDALHALSSTALEFPAETLDYPYTISCSLPRTKVSALIGKHGYHIQAVQRSTGTRCVFEKEADTDMETMIITGPLIGTYRAHALMMRRYHEDDIEQEAAKAPIAVPEPPPADVSALQAKVEELQKELERAQSQAAAATKGKGKGGKKGK